MGFLIVAGCCIAGLILGGMFGNDDAVALGFVIGFVAGIVFARLRTLAQRLDALRRQIDALQAASHTVVAMPTAVSAPAGAPAPAPRRVAQATPPLVPDFSIDLGGPATLDVDAIAQSPASPRMPPARAVAPTEPGPLEKLVAAVKRWFSEGNVPVKVGMLVLFAGVAALLKYATDEGWFSLPIEFRLAGTSAAAIAALVFGWHERVRRRSFGLALQGGAIGVLLLTVFAAFRLYHVLPAPAAFALLLCLVAGAGVLAVMQDALALAVLGILAGFAAPILISTGDGSHVVLFSYYALLNLGIFAIAWVRPWRALNLLGFAFTYAIGTAWGVLRYDSALFASTEPFLLLNFALYLAVPVLYARRMAEAQHVPARRDLIDGTLVFGNPLLAFALQAALLHGERLPLAWSALALAAIYALLGWRLLLRMRALGESFAVLAVGFATLAVPLALSARVTACTFALEGAGLIWLGLRQHRVLPRISGLALQAVAALAFVAALVFSSQESHPLPVANGQCISALLIAAAGFLSAWLHRRSGADTRLAVLLYLWGMAWWLGAVLAEIDRFVPMRLQPHALLAAVALTAALAALAHARVRDAASAWTAALALAGAIALVFAFADADAHLVAGWSAAAFAAYAVAGFCALRALRDSSLAIVRIAHGGWLWTWTFALALLLRQASVDAHLGAGWYDGLTATPLLAAWAICLLRPMSIAAPLATRMPDYRGTLLLSQAAVGAIIFISLLSHAGDTTPLTFVPLLNPVELVQVAALALAWRWLSDADAPESLRAWRPRLLAAAAFALVTAATLRGAHQLGGVAWDERVWNSNLAQTSLTVAWSLLGVLGWVLGSRRGQRTLWLAGALLMGVVLAKLLLVDRGHLGNLFGIASFIAYGLLCTVIGYIAPAPPRSDASVQEASA